MELVDQKPFIKVTDSVGIAVFFHKREHFCRAEFELKATVISFEHTLCGEGDNQVLVISYNHDHVIKLFAHWTEKTYIYRFYFAYGTYDNANSVNNIPNNYQFDKYYDLPVSYSQTKELLTFEDYARLIQSKTSFIEPEHYKAYAWFRWYNNYDNLSEASDENPDYALNTEDWYIDRNYYKMQKLKE